MYFLIINHITKNVIIIRLILRKLTGVENYDIRQFKNYLVSKTN